jgi:predicted nucleotidyltransferase
MYLEPLPKTSVEILAFLSSRLRDKFTVRQIAKGIGHDYKITHEMTMRLARQNLIIAEKRRPVTSCAVSLKGNAMLLAYVEAIRASRYFARHRDITILVNNVLERIASPFFMMMLFGSHVKGAASKRSDVDILIVIPDKVRENEISSAVASAERISPIGIHDVTLTADEFVGLLKEKKPNVAWEALDSRIVFYGAEALFRILDGVM